MEKSSARLWDLPSAVYLFLAILFSAWRLQSTGWTDGLEHVRNMALLGLIVGLALGQSRFQKRGVTLLAIGYMLVFFIWQLLGMIKFGSTETDFGGRLIVLAGRLFLGLSESFAGRPVKDPLFFVAILCIPYWVAALVSGFQLTRHSNALAAVLPNGILMFVIYINHYTTHDYSWLFGLYIFAALLLLGRQKYLSDRKNWLARRVRVSAESGIDFNNAIMVSAAILILIAWITPSPLTLNTEVSAAWKTISKRIFPKNNQLENLFAAAKKEPLPASDFYRNEMALGTQAIQSPNVAFLVYVTPTAVELPRLYWRARVYDRYENGNWITTGAEGLNYKPQDGNFKIPNMGNRISMNFTFNVYIKGQNILYSAAQPLWVSRPASIVYKQIPKGPALNTTIDIMAVQASPPLEAGDTYQATALIANPTITDLQIAGDSYPTWLRDRYLQLPNNFSARIRALALNITAAQNNPYDKTSAITNYLRSEIQYSPSIVFPVQPVDPLEYFLFDIKQGFCNYYASAEVLMLRSVGIPARLAVGFAQGEANLQNTFYTVRERDAHAWPEVYFPNYGWIEFEPTVNQNPLNRPEKIKEAPVLTPEFKTPVPQKIPQEDSIIPDTIKKPGEIFTRAQIFQIGVIISGVLLVFLVIILMRRFAPNIQTALILKSAVERNGWEVPSWLNRWASWTLLTPIEKSFQSINTGLRWMKRQQPVYVTPTERAKILTELVPSAAADIEILLREHQSALFTQHGGNVVLTRRAARKILYQALYTHIKIFILGYN